MANDEVKVQSSAGPQGTGGFDQGAACTEVYDADDAAWPQSRVRDVVGRPAVARFASTIFYELTHN